MAGQQLLNWACPSLFPTAVTAQIKPAPRIRNAAATRQAMLEAARSKFACESYENVGLREIAAEVGVDPALICRYFGSKEELFREVLDNDSPLPLFENVDAEDIPDQLVSLILDVERDGAEAAVKRDRLLIIMHSFSSPSASAIVGEAIDQVILKPIAARIGGREASLRAGLALAVLMGSGILFNVMKDGGATGSDDREVRARLLRLFRTALDLDAAA